ncbi:MAG: universal stress protein [Dehalococcoidales bacterium]|jgi:nucleotide-binding universal stress UspA family protein|nr:universal stress protein [Dehalococcoidales bacterium]
MYKKIMVPLDGSELAECVFPHLETIVKGCQPPAEVIVVQAVEPLSVPYGREVSQFTSLEQVEAFETHQKTEAEKYLKKVVARLKQTGVNARAGVIYGKAGESLSDYVTHNGIDLVIIATHGRSGISRWVLGSVANRIVHSARAPVLMVRAPECGPGI